jgi:hypothetical protein
MRTKGQAAMEFLMTYGWAILAAIIVIGLLGYYFISVGTGRSAALVNAPFYANAWNAKTTGITLELENNGGETLNVTDVTVTGCGSTASAPGEVEAGAKLTATMACALTEGDAFKGDITITYTKADSAVELTSTGSMTQTVTAA